MVFERFCEALAGPRDTESLLACGLELIFFYSRALVGVQPSVTAKESQRRSTVQAKLA